MTEEQADIVIDLLKQAVRELQRLNKNDLIKRMGRTSDT